MKLRSSLAPISLKAAMQVRLLRPQVVCRAHNFLTFCEGWLAVLVHRLDPLCGCLARVHEAISETLSRANAACVWKLVNRECAESRGHSIECLGLVHVIDIVEKGSRVRAIGDNPIRTTIATGEDFRQYINIGAGNLTQGKESLETVSAGVPGGIFLQFALRRHLIASELASPAYSGNRSYSLHPRGPLTAISRRIPQQRGYQSASGKSRRHQASLLQFHFGHFLPFREAS